MNLNKQWECLANKSTDLLNELEGIYLFSGWRSYPDKVRREAEIKNEITKIQIEAKRIEL